MTARTGDHRLLSRARSSVLLFGLALVGFLTGGLFQGAKEDDAEVVAPPNVIVRDSVILASETLALLEHARDSVTHSEKTYQLVIVLARKAIVMGDDDLGRQLRELVRVIPDSFAIVVLAEVHDSTSVTRFLRAERLVLPMITADLKTVLSPSTQLLGMPSVLIVAGGDTSALMLRPVRNASGVRLQSYANALDFSD